MRVLVVGEESAGAQALRLAVDRGNTVVAALTASSGVPGSMAAVASDAGVPVFDPGRVAEPAFARWIAGEAVDLLLNVHSLNIAHGDVVEAPRIGSYNLHPGPLPRYAGLNAPSWAIYEGEERHAVTVHRMAADVDAGAIAYEHWFPIGPTDTGLRVATACVRHGLPLLARLLDAAAQGPGHIPAREQDLAERRWFGRGAPNGGQLRWDGPARRVVDHVRAADYGPFRSPWGVPGTTLGGEPLGIVRASATGDPTTDPPGTVGPATERGVPVACADRWVVVERVRVGRRTVTAADVVPEGVRLGVDNRGAAPGM